MKSGNDVKMDVTLTVHIPAVIRKEGDVHVALCPPLDVVSQGDTQEEARKMLGEAVALFLGTCIEMGTFSQVLKDCGFTMEDRNATIQKDDEYEQMEIPLPFVMDGKDGQCHA